MTAAARMAGASNGFGAHSPGLYNLTAAAIAEIVATAVFLFIIIGATDRRAPVGSRRWRSASRSRWCTC